jgi:glycosyltransferase involved in cell wall biosynthesis
LSGQVHYVGKKYGTDKEAIFSKADIFAFPTYYETFGLVNLEAMQFCLPIVSTFEGGIPDVVNDGKTGFLVPQKDAKALADKLERLIKNPALRKQMGKAGREKYEKEFTLNAFEKRLKEILTKITAE